MIDLERPRWRMAMACEIAGIEDHSVARTWRKDYGLRIGKLERGGWRFSVLDIGELTEIRALRVLGILPAEAIALARDEGRAELEGVLTDRLHWGFWSLGQIVVDDTTGPVPVSRGFYLEAIAERLIDKLELPLPTNPPLPKSSVVARKMKAAILTYFLSPPGFERWKRWRISVIERHNGEIPFAQAAFELGAPEWFLRDMLHAERRHNLIQVLRPEAEQIRERLEGVTLQ